MGGVTRRVAAFLDRDGVLNVRAPEHAYVTSVDGFRWIEGAAIGAARIAALGFTLFVVSNQRGVARGLVTASCLREIEERIDTQLAASARRSRPSATACTSSTRGARAASRHREC